MMSLKVSSSTLSCTVHDDGGDMTCPAAIVGDIAPSDNITKEVKNQLEAEAMLKIKDMLGAETAAGEQWL